MKIATKSTALVVMLFVLGLVMAASWVERDFRETSQEVMSDTAELIASQISAAIYETVIDQAVKREPGAYQTLRDTVESAVDRSDTILELVVIDADGAHLAGGKDEASYPDAEALFGAQPVTQVASQYESRFSIGHHIVLVPLTRKGVMAAYLRIELSNRRIDGIYNRLVSRFANFALIGIATILFLGGLLHLELSRIGGEIVSLMNPAKAGTAKSKRFGSDEFDSVRNSAIEFGRHNRQRKTAIDALTNALEIGLVFFQSPGKPSFNSNSAREMLGCGENEDDFPNTVDEVGWTEVSTAVDDLVASSETTSISNVSFTCGDELRHLEFELFQIDETDAGVIAVIRNQEQVSALQSSLRAATRMHTLSSIYMGAAHDLRGPISAMIMNLDLLEESVRENEQALTVDSVDRQSRYIGILRDELVRLQRFLTGFLENATMIESKTRDLIELTGIVEELFSLFRIKARLTGVELATKFPETPIYVLGSGEQIRQLFMNIIVNALESMPDGGKLTVTIDSERGIANIRFMDTGPGLPSTLADQVFDLHFTTKDTGTGIGLHVAKTIVQHHDGDISFDSKLGSGSTVSIKLPATDRDRGRLEFSPDAASVTLT